MDAVRVGLLGLGTVGSAVARLLVQEARRLERRAGRSIELSWALVRDASQDRGVPLGRDRIVTDWRRIVDDPGVSVVVELMGGTTGTLPVVLAALESGKDVVTANKALLAEHGREVFAQARKHGRSVSFEASVGGGMPIVQALGVGLAANQVQSLAAIVNGTCNFILSAMSRSGLSYESALAEAQALGFAEADPTLDVDGTDTAHKLSILAQIAFGADLRLSEIPRQGIDRLHSADIRYSAELGYAIKLLAKARLAAGGLELRVAPTLVRQGTPLAEVRGAYNAIRVVGDVVGDTLFYGQGAGAKATASAVVGDLIDVVVGRAKKTFDALDLWPEEAPAARLASAEHVKSRYYLRFSIADRPGVLGAIAQVLGKEGISIASVIQHDPGDDDHPEAPVPLILMTHSAAQARLEAALREIDRLEVVKAATVCLGVEES